MHLYGNNSSDSETITVDNLPYEEDRLYYAFELNPDYDKNSPESAIVSGGDYNFYNNGYKTMYTPDYYMGTEDFANFDNTITVTNTLETTQITAKKEWESRVDGPSIPQVTMKLYFVEEWADDNNPILEEDNLVGTAVLSEKENWRHIWADLPLYHPQDASVIGATGALNPTIYRVAEAESDDYVLVKGPVESTDNMGCQIFTFTNRLTADDRYTINYAGETITIADGYEVYTAETEGDKIQSGGSITAYIGKSLYIQKTDPETTRRTEIKIPARPEAPKTTDINISYSTEKLTIAPQSALSADNLEYTTQGDQTDRKWTAVPESLLLSEMGWTGSQMNLYFRIKATESSFASEATTTGKEIPSRPQMPTSVSTMQGRTENSITIDATSGQEYRCGIGATWGEWETIIGDSNLITFENLSPGTEYTIQNRYKSGRDDTTNEAQFASFANSTTIFTSPSITTTSLETGYVGVPYSAQLEAVVADGTNVTWSLENSS